MSRDYHQDRRERWPLVWELVKLGFTVPETAEFVGWSAGAVGNDIKARGGMAKCFPDRPSKRERFPVFVHRLVEYTAATPAVDSVEARVFHSLQEYFFVELGVVDFAHGVIRGLWPFMRPRVYPEQEPYIALVAAVLGIYEQSEPKPDLVQLVLRGIDLGDHKTPQDLTEFQALIVQEGHELTAGRKMCPHWRIDDHEWIDDCLRSRLTPREITVVTKVYGLNGDPPRTQREIARELGYSNGRVSQFLTKALRKLRRLPADKQHFEDLWWTLEPNEVQSLRASLTQTREKVDKLEQQILRLEMREPGRMVSTPKVDLDPAMIQNLMKPVSDFELSTRTHNCLQNQDVMFLFEVAVRREADLLRTKNFGRKSLNELKEILVDLGLSLGMPLPKTFVENLLAWRVLKSSLACHCHNHDSRRSTHPSPELDTKLDQASIWIWADLLTNSEAELRERVPSLTDENVDEIKHVLKRACRSVSIHCRDRYTGTAEFTCTPISLGNVPSWILPLL